MSEISDAVQIIRVTYDGIEIAFKIGSGTLGLMKKALKLIVGMLEYEKTAGKTNMRKLLQKGGSIHALSFANEDMKKFKRMAKKYGILYSAIPNADRNNGLTEVLFHSEAAPRMQMLVQKLKNGRLFNIDEYLKNGNEEQLNKLLDYLDKLRKGNKSLNTEESYIADNAIDGMIQKVGMYAMEKQTISVEQIKQDLKIEEQEAKNVVSKLEKIGVLDKQETTNSYNVIMDRNAFEKRIQRFQELSNRMRQIAASKNTNLIDVTISKTMISRETERAVKTRVPGMYGANAGYIWLKKQDVMEIHNGKTLLTYLDKNKEYKIYSEDNRVLRTMKGEHLFRNHYDIVEKKVRERYEKTAPIPVRQGTQTRRR